MKNSKIIYDNIYIFITKNWRHIQILDRINKEDFKKRKLFFYELENNNLFRKKIKIKFSKEAGISF